MALLVSEAQTIDNLTTIRTDKLASVTIRLFKDDLPADPETDISTLLTSECDYDDYTPLTAQSTTLIVDDAGVVKLVSPNCIFTCSADQSTSNTVYGFFVTDGASVPTLYGFEKFDSPQPMALVGDTTSFVVHYELLPPQGTVTMTE